MRAPIYRIWLCLLSIIFFCPGANLLATDPAKEYFKLGEKLLADGKPFEAYQEFEQAVRLQSSNRKYLSKLQEAGKVASVRADMLGQETLHKDLNEARKWFDAALRYDSTNASASQHRAELDQSISEAQATVRRTIEAIKRGETSDTEGILANLSRFHALVPDIEIAKKELRADRTLEQAQSEWARSDRINALRDIERAEVGASADNTYVSIAAKKLRNDIATFVLKEAPEHPASVKEILLTLEVAQSALSIDNANSAAINLKIEQAPRLASFVFDRVQNLRSTPSPASARFAIEILRRNEKWISSDERFISRGQDLSAAAYPGLEVRLVVGQAQGCETQSNGLVEAVRQSLGRVARLSDSPGDVTIRIARINCSATDMPIDNVQQVNSTYVAAHTQLANPTYVQLQSQLDAAQQDLNRAQYNNSVNPNFGNAFAVGFAQGRVNRLRNALASTPPYSSQEVVQPYQYQKFEAHREYQVQAIVQGEYQHGRNLLPEETVTSLKQDRKPGVAGVLPQDKSGVTNYQPVLKSASECAREAWEEFTTKTSTAVRNMVATVLAKRAMIANPNPVDRLASMMYLSELAPGTKYENMTGSIEGFISSAIVTDDNQLTQLNWPALPVPDDTAVTPEPVEQDATRIERAIESVVSIETDTGHGSGFFLSPGCLVITNEHVISGADTIIARETLIKASLSTGSIDKVVPA